MNLSIHLPQPLLGNLDSFAKSQNMSRSSVVREAVESYLAQKTARQWPADILLWMSLPAIEGDGFGLPDFDAMRDEANASAQLRSGALIEDFFQ